MDFLSAFTRVLWFSLSFCGISISWTVEAGSFYPAADEIGTSALSFDSSSGAVSIWTGWASEVESVDYGELVDDVWKTPEKALGPATGQVGDIVSLGRGGSIVLTWDNPLQDRPGWDFAVFENGLSDFFLELAWVEVSSDGKNYLRFPAYSEGENPVAPYGIVDPTTLQGFAGKYRLGFGVPFDFSILRTAVGAEKIDFQNIRYLRVIDVVGDGSEQDAQGRAIYDPYPTFGSQGFDLEAVGAIQWPVPTIEKTEIIGQAVYLEWTGSALRPYELLGSKDGATWSQLKDLGQGSGESRTVTLPLNTIPTFLRIIDRGLK